MKALASRVRIKPIWLLLAWAVILAILVYPYVFNSSLQSTARVESSSSVSASQLPQVAGLYLDAGEQYYLSILRPMAGNQTWAVVAPTPLTPGSLVYLASTVADWNVQPYSMSILGNSGFDRLVVTSSITVLPNGTASQELWLTSSGATLLGLSTMVALLGPLVFMAIAWFFMKRLPLWLIVGVVWAYVAEFLAVDVMGAGYGLYPSTILAAVAVLLIPAAYIANKIELSVRKRLGTRNVSAG